MKYGKITRPEPNNKNTYYDKAETKQELIDSLNYAYDSIYTEISKEEYDHYFGVLEIQRKALKGQEVENAIELNDAFKYYTTKLIRDTEFLIYGNLLDIALNPTDIAHQRTYNDNMKVGKAYRRMLESIIKYERSVSIATNSDPTHPVAIPNTQDMINLASHIKANDPELGKDITKLASVEESYEPKEVIDSIVAIMTAVNSHAHPTTDKDPLNVGELVSGGTT